MGTGNQHTLGENIRLVNALQTDFFVDLSQWLTIKRYADKYGVSQQVVVNWIRRGSIPITCVLDIPELNDIRLVRDQVYK